MTSVLMSLRQRKLELYAAAGALGGVVGALFGEIASPDRMPTERLHSVIMTALWSAAFASILGLTLFAAGEWYQRHILKPYLLLRVLLMSAVAGLASGALAQYLYSMDIGSFAIKNYALRIAAWALMGAMLGALLSRYVPNLSVLRGLAAGALGGGLGCMGALCTWMFLPGFAGRIVGIALLGLALGLAMYLVESLFREVSVEVEWAPNETSTISLGAHPVTIGGSGEEHIYVKGLPPHVSSLILDNGQIEHIETATGKRTPLRDGSRLRIGVVNMTIHAAAAMSGAPLNRRRNTITAGTAAAIIVIAAVALTALGPRPRATGEQASTRSLSGPSRITLSAPGQSAQLDTSNPITNVNVRLQWHAAVDLDLHAFYLTKSGQPGEIYFSNRIGPHIRLDRDAGVGNLAGNNEENITIASLDDFKTILFATKIFSKGGSYRDYDGRVAVQTNNGDDVIVPLISNERADWCVIAKLDNAGDKPRIINVNRVTNNNPIDSLTGP